MQVTEIAFDPYNPGRILVGTRDAGIICTADDGRTWRTIYLSDYVKYVTGFHFQPNGGVYISSYGTGLWRLKPSTNCGKTYRHPWDVTDPVAGDIGVTDVQPPKPRGIAAPDRPKLFLVVGEPEPSSDVRPLTIAGRGFGRSQEIALQCREISSLAARVRTDDTGQFSLTLPIPATFPVGDFTIEAHGPAGGVLTASEFRKPLADDAPRSSGGIRQQR
jgi:hypothetical protein